jgi:acetylornithine deacetylase/succinyl-diaminopimelate desuccinylase-like protein
MTPDTRSAVEDDSARIQNELELLVRIPSVSAPGYPPTEVRRSAETVASLLTESGLENVQLLEVDGAHPAVYGEIPGPVGAPTILLYAHHDVQPPGPADQWESPPFEPIEKDGRLFGRGSADDKAGIVLHLASIRALGDDVPVTIKVFIEGEEEIGSAHLSDFLDKYKDMLAADVVVIGDAGNWRVGVPTITTSLRGLVDCKVTVRTLSHAVHSGSFGGTYPDANIALARVLASLHNDDGSVAVQGLLEYDAEPLDLTEEELASAMLPVEGLELMGRGSLTSRLWTRPSIAVLAIDSVPIGEAINQLVPEASAKVSMRIPPGQDPKIAMEALVSHIEGAAPWGAQVLIEKGAMGSAIHLGTDGDVFNAYRDGMREGYGAEPMDAGMGGSIPFVAALSEMYPEAAFLMIGVADPTSNYHGPNENVELADILSAAVSQSVAIRQLANG